ncbi:triose-phosphate transporter family-domain-containing protein [Radiomyces spectabilis]|uniref:triose-phosphate transporter family-domain-containing protein n=1 Tax=Radiomyces spectabilis TaxID=64574 RepID=UPI00221F04C8|nr:triose-phosphate transporter family-domain-containing protein [Radiomyces spectabilis]KAI8381568.1 triose-phosphate transporter family-domain-containing protein [Radiomyces spectabilis]
MGTALSPVHTSVHDDTQPHASKSSSSLRSSSESNDSLFHDDLDSLPSETLLRGDHKSQSQRLLNEHKKAILKTSAINVFWILMWYTFATFLSVYNKWIFSIDYYGFQFPLFVTTIHMVVQFFFAGTSLVIAPKLRPTKRPTVTEYIYKVLPCALATSLDIGLSNLSLKTITLSFYTMCKSSTLAFVLIFAFLFKLEKPNWKLILIIVIISAGVLLMVSSETEFVMIGFLEVMAASACGGLRWSLTEVLLRKESMGLTNPFVSIFFLAPAQALILFILAGAVEGYGTIFRSAFFVSFPEGVHTIFIILAGGTLAFCMIMSEFFLIKRTSVVTLSVCGIFKEVATILVSCVIFGDRLTIPNIIGLCITLFGIGLYNWLKMRNLSVNTQKTMEAEDDLRLEEEPFQEEHNPHHSSHLYSMVAESTPILLVDGALSTYRNSEEHEDQYELR